jgi:methyltransferase (TIGR00027 family)
VTTSPQQSSATTANPVAWTARWTAAARALESERSDRLFADPLARALADEQGLTVLHEVNESSAGHGQATYIALRTRFFDDFLFEVVHRMPIRQVVILAAGMDTRVFRLSWPSATAVYELDQPDLLCLKNDILAREDAQPRCQRCTIGVDLEQEWCEPLQGAGFLPDEPSIWLAEGFFYYLEESGVRTVLEQMTALAGPNSWLGTDFLNHALIIHPWFKEMCDALESRGISWRFATDEPEALLAEYGWSAEAIQPGHERANFGRWPYPVLARELPGCPRSLLVTAHRDTTILP